MSYKVITGPEAANYYGWNFVVIDESVNDALWEGNVAAFMREDDANAYVAAKSPQPTKGGSE